MFSFCRFCAQPKEHSELVTDLENISEMYKRICPKYDPKSSNKLPQRICSPCSDRLLNCWNFIEQIESAEEKLTKMILNESEKALPVEEVIVCENSILIFESKVEQLKPLGMEKASIKAETLNESDIEHSDQDVKPKDESDAEQSENPEAQLMDESDTDESDTDQRSNRGYKKGQGEPIDPEIKHQEYKLNRKRRRMKYVKFFSEVPRGEILADGTISEKTVSKLETRFPEMKTISWNTCEYKCAKCLQIVEGTNQFFIHIQSKHFEELDSYRFPCYHCNDVYESLFKLNRHIGIKHFIHLRYRCSVCPKMYFWNLNALYKHQKSHPKPKYDCHLCKKTGLHELSFVKHIQYSHLMKENPEKFEKYICDICQIQCISKGRIKSHMKTHSTTKDFVCHYCAHRFKTQGSLKCHIEVMHTVSEKIYTCPIENCGKKFRTKNRVNTHIKVHGPKEHACDICGTVVASKTMLRLHQLIHENKRPHKCSMCEKTFRLTQSLKVHERIHTGATPYMCPKCPYRSANWGNLEKHTNRIHSISMKKNHHTRLNIKQQNPSEQK